MQQRLEPEIASNVSCRESSAAAASETAATRTISAGRIRRARRAQNAGRSIRPFRACSPASSDVIREPEITKNTSTPTNPDGSSAAAAWYSTTASTAIARRPSISGR